MKVTHRDKIVWKRDLTAARGTEFEGWLASYDGSHVGTVFVDGDVAYAGNCYSFGSQALAAENLVLYVERGGR